MSPAPARRLLALLWGLALAPGCRISNDDHCVHKAIESDAWCAENEPGRPFCSPCEGERHGCVEDPPDADECPAYMPDAGASSSGSSSTGAASSTG